MASEPGYHRPPPGRIPLLGKLLGITHVVVLIRHVVRQQEKIMREIDALVTKVQGLTEDTARVLEAVKGERLSDETRAQVEALGAKLDEVNAAMDAAVPPAAEPTTGDGTDTEPSDGDSDGSNSSTRGRSRR